MKDEVNQLIETVLESDDFDTKEVSGQPLEDMLTEAGFKPFGEMKDLWSKAMADEAVTVSIHRERSIAGTRIFSIGYYKRGQAGGWVPSSRFECGEGGVAQMVAKYRSIPVQESDDFDMKEVAGDVTLDFLKRYGFRQSRLAPFGWVKENGDLAIDINYFKEHEFVVKFYENVQGAWKVVQNHKVDEAGLAALLKDLGESPVSEAMEDDFDSKEVYAFDYLDDIIQYVDRGILDVGGKVTRTSNHYVHERTTSFSLREDWTWPDEIPYEEQQEIEVRIGNLINRLEKDIDERMVAWNKKMYRELEQAYEWSVSDEVVRENIESNDYTFDEDGRRDDASDLRYNQLSDRAQQRAREWYTTTSLEMGETSYAEPVEAEWKWLLKNKGFGGVEIAWRGFWSQGDGASFTADSFDIKLYKNFADPLDFPEQEREMIEESEEGDFKEILGEPPPAETFRVMSSHGEFEARVEDGQVLKAELYEPVDADAENLRNIDRFDVDEWRTHWKEELKPGTSQDILDFGYWNKDGSYERPVDDFRREALFYGVEGNPVNEDEDSEADDAKDVYGTNRRPLKHIDNAHDYAEYQARFSDFMESEGIQNLSSGEELGFSWRPCEVCHRSLGGERYQASGYNPTTREVQEYQICSDCMYYAEYGQLDDMTMMKIEDSKKELGLGEAIEDDDFKDVHGTPPPEPVFTATSSWGEVIARVDDGVVVSVKLNDPPPAEHQEGDVGIDDIAKFDLGEFRRYYPNRHIKDGDRIDVLDLGFWDKTGEYLPPDDGYREIRVEIWMDNGEEGI